MGREAMTPSIRGTPDRRSQLALAADASGLSSSAPRGRPSLSRRCPPSPRQRAWRPRVASLPPSIRPTSFASSFRLPPPPFSTLRASLNPRPPRIFSLSQLRTTSPYASLVDPECRKLLVRHSGRHSIIILGVQNIFPFYFIYNHI
jgi:hypothetical protein